MWPIRWVAVLVLPLLLLRPPDGVAQTVSNIGSTVTISGTADVNLTQLNGVALGASLPVSGTVTANAGTNLNTSLLALEAGGNLATLVGKDFATQTTLATLLKPADTLAAVTTVGTITNPVLVKPDGTIWTLTGTSPNVNITNASLAVTGTFWQATQPVSNAGTFVVQENGAALTALQLIDDVVSVDDTTTHSTGNTKGVNLMAVATPTDAAVGANDIGMVAMTLGRGLYSTMRDAAGNDRGANVDASNRLTTLATITDGTNILPSATAAPAQTDRGLNVRPIPLDPCSGAAKSYFPVDIVTATTTEIANAVASNYFYFCSIFLHSAGTNNVTIVEDDSDACASPTAGIIGGVTAAEGPNLTAQTGFTLGNGLGSVARTAATNRYICIITSAAIQLSGMISYVAAP